MWHTIILSALAGIMGANAVPHFVKGITGEAFPNVTGNSPLRNAVAGLLGFMITALIGFWAELPDYPWPGVIALCVGALTMTVFHGVGGAYRLNTALGLPNPPRPNATV